MNKTTPNSGTNDLPENGRTGSACDSTGPTEAEIVFAAVASGDWKITRNQPSGYMTDEGNARTAWTAERANAPYCVDLGPGKGWGNRHWSAATAIGALQAASKEMGIALPAPAQPAAQQGVAYAALPAKYYLAGGEVPTWDEKQMHAFADRTHAIRVSHGPAPAGATPECLTCSDHGAVGNILTAEPCPDCTRLNAQPAPATRQAPPPPPECETEAEKRAFAFGWFKALESERVKADSVREDAARLDFLIDQGAYVVSDPDTCTGHWLHWAMPDGSTLVQCDEYPTPRAAIDAARKQGESNDR